MADKKKLTELEELELEETRLRVEDLRNRVETERARRNQIIRNHKQQQEAIEQKMRQIMAEQKICKHKKGGKNLEGVLNGSDSQYSVINHTYPWGEQSVTCTRCGKDWREPAKELKATNPAAYKQAYQEWIEALNFPTDNEPSGTRLFVITNNAA